MIDNLWLLTIPQGQQAGSISGTITLPVVSSSSTDATVSYAATLWEQHGTMYPKLEDSYKELTLSYFYIQASLRGTTIMSLEALLTFELFPLIPDGADGSRKFDRLKSIKFGFPYASRTVTINKTSLDSAWRGRGPNPEDGGYYDLDSTSFGSWFASNLDLSTVMSSGIVEMTFEMEWE